MINEHPKVSLEMINMVIELFATGNSEIQVAAKLKMSKQKFKSLYESIEGTELKNAVEYGRTLHEAFSESLVQNGMVGTIDGSDALIKMYMQNKFGWNDKSQVVETKTVTSSLSDEELDREIEKLQCPMSNKD